MALKNYRKQSNDIIQDNNSCTSGFKLETLETCFTYRFISFKWLDHLSRFEPIRFPCEGRPYDELRSIYTNPERANN